MISLVPVYIKPLLVIDTASTAELPRVTEDSSSSSPQLELPKPTTVFWPPTSQALSQTFSSVPIVNSSELTADYLDLGEALNEMAEMSTEDDYWGIEQPVFHAACAVAEGLAAKSFPAPKLLSHGPKSVIFNWTRGKNNLYLTISADRLSALLSTPERIQRRVDFGNMLEQQQPAALLRQILALPSESTLSGASNR